MTTNTKAINQKTIYFRNDTEMPIMIQNWCPYLEGSFSLRTLMVAPRQIEILFCAIGEWYVNLVSENPDNEPTLIGTFWCQPSACGDYSFMEIDDYACEYTTNHPFRDGVTYGMIMLKNKQSEKRILKRTRMIEEELLQNRFHPRNIPHFVDWGWNNNYADDE